ncbi:MAG: YeiH family protein [Steroidobacteraceae bacterium]
MGALVNSAAGLAGERVPGGWNRLAGILPGLLLMAAIALVAIVLSNLAFFQRNGISALTMAIVLGMTVGNTIYPQVAAASCAGVAFSKQTLLRAGIILYGLRLTFQDIAHVGVAGVVIDLVVLSSTFALSLWAGTHLFGLDRKTAMLIGAGSSICGAAAVMAAEPVVRGRPEHVTAAVSTVVVFGTLAIFVYPALYHLNSRYQLLHVTPAAYGIFAGSTIHEVAQVVAAGRAVADSAADTAVITKMVRVMMLAPFLMILSACLSRRPDDAADVSSQCASPRRRIVVPWFAMGFAAVAAVNSLIDLPRSWVSSAITIDTFVLAMAMAALGVSTHVSAIRCAGFRPLALAALLFAWLIAGGLAINAGISAVLA